MADKMLEDVCSETEPDKDEAIVDYRVYAFPTGSVDASDFNRKKLEEEIASGDWKKYRKELWKQTSILYGIYRFIYAALTAK